MWRLYGWFTGLMMFGCCFGAVTWAARMVNLVSALNGVDLASKNLLVQSYSLLEVSLHFRAAFTVTYAVEFLCLSTAKLMVLDRLLEFAVVHGDSARQIYVATGRVVIAAVVMGNAVGLAGNIASAVYTESAAAALQDTVAYLIANNTPQALNSEATSREAVGHASSVSSVQAFSEVAVLLLIVAAFLAAGILCARRISRLLLAVSAASTAGVVGRALRLQIMATAGFVFVAFILRSVFSIMYALSYQFQDVSNQCPGSPSLCSATCYNVFTHIQRWLLSTPEFQLITVLISSPLALLVALWGMTNRSVIFQRGPALVENTLSPSRLK